MAARTPGAAALSETMRALLLFVYAAPNRACPLPYRRGASQTAGGLRRLGLLDGFVRNDVRYLFLTAEGKALAEGLAVGMSRE